MTKKIPEPTVKPKERAFLVGVDLYQQPGLLTEADTRSVKRNRVLERRIGLCRGLDWDNDHNRCYKHRDRGLSTGSALCHTKSE